MADSPYLLQFLLSQAFPGVSSNQKKTTAGKLPQKISGSIFDGIAKNPSSAYNTLSLLAGGAASTRAYADNAHAIKMNKLLAKQQAAANAKAQNDYLAKLQKILKANQASPGQYNPGGPNYTPTVPNTNGNNNGSILPPIVNDPQQEKWEEMNRWACKTYGVCNGSYKPLPESHISQG